MRTFLLMSWLIGLADNAPTQRRPWRNGACPWRRLPWGRSAKPSACERFAAAAGAHPEVTSFVSFESDPGPLYRFLPRNRRRRAFVWDLGIGEPVRWAGARASGGRLRGSQADPQEALAPSVSMEDLLAMRYQTEVAPEAGGGFGAFREMGARGRCRQVDLVPGTCRFARASL
jgi:hypothetical protein